MAELTFTADLPGKDQFFKLFLTTGWNDIYRLNEDEYFKALKQSWYYLSAYDQEKLVGFGRIICDGVVHALILDLIVHPDFRSKGIGGKILEQLVEKCHQHRIRDVQLFCAKGYAGFYEKRGFRKRPDDAPGMEIKLELQ
jgi:GNAT superfamily N-acetyltransferase